MFHNLDFFDQDLDFKHNFDVQAKLEMFTIIFIFD